MKNTATAEAIAPNLAGKYLTFKLDRETHGIEILKVQEIIGVSSVTRVPQTPEFIRGVINLRGKVIPVVDLRLSFGLPGQEDTDRTCIIVVRLQREGQLLTLGIVVDEVLEVLFIEAEQIEPPPAFGGGVRMDFILGMGKFEKAVVVLLDVDQVLSGHERSRSVAGAL